MRILTAAALAAVAVVLALGAALVPASVAARAQEHDPTRRDLDDYRLRVGDRIEIVVYNGRSVEPEKGLSRAYTVPGNGNVSFPPVGKVNLLGKTAFEVEETIAQKLKDENFLTNPNVGCIVTAFEPRFVSLFGAVQGQITLPVHREMRILEVLAQAGSIGIEGADFSRVRIRRMGRDGMPFHVEVNVDDILERNQEEKNIVVFEGDIIHVPHLQQASPLAADWVYVLGKVRTPGRHPIVKGRSPFTLTKLIAMVGDFQEFADRSKVKIIRTTQTGRQPYVLDFDDIIGGDIPDFELKPDDLIYVPESWI